MMSMDSSKRAPPSSIGNAEAGEFVVPIAFADAEIEPPAGQQVDRGGLFGEQHRIVPGQHDDRGAEPQGGGFGADPAQQVQRGGDLAEAGEMMLDDKGAVVAEGFGLDEVFDVVVEAGRAVDVGPPPRCACAAPKSPKRMVALPVSLRRKIVGRRRNVQCGIRRRGAAQPGACGRWRVGARVAAATCARADSLACSGRCGMAPRHVASEVIPVRGVHT